MLEYILLIIIVFALFFILKTWKNRKNNYIKPELNDEPLYSNLRKQKEKINSNKLLQQNNLDNSGKDHFDDVMFGNHESRKLSARITFDYVDANGNNTHRTVKIRRYDTGAGSSGALDGFCELRRGTRGFRYERMSNIYDAETGEIIPSIQAYLDDLYEAEQARIAEEERLAQEAYQKTPEYTAEFALNNYKNFLQAVYYIARADGACRKPEKEIILKYINELIAEQTQSNLTLDLLDKILKRDVPDCSYQTFQSKIRMIVKNDLNEFANLHACCQEIVGTDKTVHQNEQEALNYMEKQAQKIEKSKNETLDLKQHA